MEEVIFQYVENENGKAWIAPELKKVAIEDLTAHLHLLHALSDDDPTS